MQFHGNWSLPLNQKSVEDSKYSALFQPREEAQPEPHRGQLPRQHSRHEEARGDAHLGDDLLRLSQGGNEARGFRGAGFLHR